eukprot:1150620-Pelagomonas_calceolata.AAC.4
MVDRKYNEDAHRPQTQEKTHLRPPRKSSCDMLRFALFNPEYHDPAWVSICPEDCHVSGLKM